ncbi:MAG: DNA-binding response regulator [Elusimicrobia bacterium CG_4_10_14_0_8_um_filter_37_32]|nr:MAG: DNA-binding response regulator [Elusimicrobia bacterium CG_4_10_14_0_8_um_filter_37_32]
MKQKIFIVDDDDTIVDLIKAILIKEKYEVSVAYNGKDAINKINSDRPNLIILDLNLPDLTGWEVCQVLKKHAQTKFIPVILLTGKYITGNDISRGLLSGGDDYITKPFNLDVLVARIKALLRRMSYRGETEEVIKHKNIIIDVTTHTLLVNDKPPKLTPKEFALLYFLVKNKGQVLSRKQLMESIWEQDYYFSSETLKKHIQTLRRKLGPAASKYVETVEGVGYKFKP